ncbi:Conserved_hypothetical protein [Hexamita inflata]|uniref:Uncharacterized protein n=1 Tax=Hexamita inflata TaxID=28002 RepID=A0AA86R052_9EUKA|nr:Conserved hypothetical protein [Hexamita inflata]
MKQMRKFPLLNAGKISTSPGIAAMQKQNNLKMIQQEIVRKQNQECSNIHTNKCKDKTIENLQNELDKLLTAKCDGYGPIMNKLLQRFEQKYRDESDKQMDEEERDFWIAVKIKSPQVYRMLQVQFCLNHPDTVDKQKYQKLEKFGLHESIIGNEYKTDHNYLGRIAETYGASSTHRVYGGISTDFCAFNLHSYMNGGKIKNFVRIKYGKNKGKLKSISHIVSFTFVPNDSFQYLVKNKQHLWSPDWTHLQKLSRYTFTKKPLSLSFYPNRGVINKEIIQGIIDQMDKNVFRDGQHLSLKLYKKQNITKLFEQPETIHSAIYFMLNYALSQMYVKMPAVQFQRLLVLDLFIMLKLYDKAQVVYHKVKDKKQLSTEDRNNPKMLTAFNFTWMRNYVVTIQKTLQTLHDFKTVSCYSMSSMPSEHLYSALRTHSHFQNDITMAEVVLNNQRLLELIEYQHKFNINNDGNRVGSHVTTTVTVDNVIPFEEETALWDLAQDAIDLIFYHNPKVPLTQSIGLLDKYNKLKNFWKDIEKTITNEHFDTRDDENINEGLLVRNVQQQSAQVVSRASPKKMKKLQNTYNIKNQRRNRSENIIKYSGIL